MPAPLFLSTRMPEAFAVELAEVANRATEPGTEARRRVLYRNYRATASYLLVDDEYSDFRDWMFDDYGDGEWIELLQPTSRGQSFRESRVVEWSGTPVGNGAWRLELQVEVRHFGPFPAPLGCEPIVQPFLTTPPYPLESVDSMQAEGGIILSGSLLGQTYEYMEGADVNHMFTAGDLRQVLKTYEIDLEALDAEGGLFTAGELRAVLKATTMRAEALDATGGLFTAGTLESRLITYSNYHIEALDADGGRITGGTLS